MDKSTKKLPKLTPQLLKRWLANGAVKRWGNLSEKEFIKELNR